jgi:hypothetical protein
MSYLAIQHEALSTAVYTGFSRSAALRILF